VSFVLSPSPGRLPALAPSSASFAPVDPRPTAAWSGFTLPSSKTAGGPHSLVPWCLATQRSSETSRLTLSTTTTSAHTPADAISVERLPSWFMVLGRCAHDEPRLSRHLVR